MLQLSINGIYWLVVWNHGILSLSLYWEFHTPNWRIHMFQRGRYTTKQDIYIYGIECGDNRDILLTNNICYLGVSESGVCNEPAREWASSWGVIIRSCADIWHMSIHINTYRCFLKWGYPKIIHVSWIFHEIYHPAIGVAPFMETSISS